MLDWHDVRQGAANRARTHIQGEQTNERITTDQ
jgi:hypothetical protein